MTRVRALVLAAAMLVAAAPPSSAETQTQRPEMVGGAPEGADADSTALQIVDARLGRGVEDREITGEDSTFAPDEKVYLWLQIAGGPADSVTVTWKRGDYTFDYRLAVGAATWRTWAYKTVWAGKWQVTVSDSKGNLLKELEFTVE